MRQTRRLAGALGIAIVVMASGCAPSLAGNGSPRPAPTEAASSPTPDPTSTRADDQPLDPVDPVQNPEEAGQIIGFAGPPYGSGVAEYVAPGLWCASLAFQPEYPDGVTFEIQNASAAPVGMTVGGAACAPDDVMCIGFTIDPAASKIVCTVSIIGPETGEWAAVTSVEGTLHCPTAEVCAAVAADRDDGGMGSG